MTDIRLRDISMHTFGELPKIGEIAPNFVVTKSDLATVSLNDFKGKAIIMNVYPSIDTNVCFNSVKKFNASHPQKDVVILCISMDSPFALRRIAEGEKLANILFLSDCRNREFGELYGLTIADGPLAGMLARAVIVLDADHRVAYHELVEDVSNPPNYQAALEAIKL